MSVTAAMLPEGPVGPGSVRGRLYRARVASDPARATPFWYLQGGDAVRAIACLGIVCFHVATGALFITGNLAGAGGTETWMTGYGESGKVVLRTLSTGFYLFFVVSGFFVSAPFVSAFVEGRPMPRLFPYFRNRALRLLPAAWLLFAFVLVRHGTNGASFGELAAMFTFADDHVDHPLSTLVGQTWTLRVDLTFYLLVPLAAALSVRLVGPRLGVAGRRRAVWLAAAAVVAVTFYIADTVPFSTGLTRSPAVLLCLFMPGVAIAAGFSGRGSLRAPPRLPLLAGVLSVGGVVLLVAFPRESLPLSGKLANVGLAAGMALGGVILLENFAGRTWRWMRATPVRWVGKHTYGIYLWHLVLMAELSRLFTGATHPTRTYFMLLPLVIATSCVVGAISYKLVERPAMQLRHRGTRRAATAPAEEAPPAAPVPATSTA
jgi:peptidoglycan/LPS O-acetylase OafA/YrhL